MNQKFKYKAYDKRGKVVSGVIEASNRKEAITNLKASELRVKTIKLKKDNVIVKAEKKFKNSFNQKKDKVFDKRKLEKRLKSLEEELKFAGFDFIDIKQGLNEYRAKGVIDFTKVKEKYSLSDIQIEKIRSGRLNVDNNKKTLETQKKFYKKNIFQRVTQNELITFTEQLSIMLSTDIELIVALETLQKEMKGKKLKIVIDKIIYDLTKGKEFSVALENNSEVFNNFYVSMVRVGEKTGSEMYRALEDVTKYLKMSKRIKGEIQKAMIYPIFLIGMMLVLILFLNYMLIPRFRTMFDGNGMELSSFTQFVFMLSENFGVIIAVALSLILGFSLCYMNIKPFKERVNRFLDYIVFKIPVVRGLARVNYMYQFTMTLAITLRNGISITDSLDLINNLIKNNLVRKDVVNIYYNLEKGRDLSDAFEDTKQFETLVKMGVSSGEKSGRLSETMDKVSKHYDEELEVKMGKLSQLIMPLSIIVMALVIGPFIVAVYSPLLSLTDQIGQMK